VCAAPEPNTENTAKPAVCTTCEEGYFGASCTACHDQANCATCLDGGEGKCTKCKMDKYLTTGGTCVETCAADTKFSVEDEQNGKRCFACGDTTNGVIGCEKCTAPGDGKAKPTCTKCIDDNYLKTVNDVTTCETNCGDGYFQHTATSGDLKTCQSCSAGTNDAPAVSGIQNCASCTYTSSTLKCAACGEGKKPNKEGTGCFDCGISGCAYCSGTGKCEECDGGKIVKTVDGATSCVTGDECTKAEGFFVKDGSTKTCEACGDENCATCAATGKNQCSKCKTTGTKTYLKGEAGTGTCVEASQCGSGFFPKADDKTGNKCVACSSASDGGIADCGECSLLTSVSRAGDILITCTKCSNNNLSPLKNECMTTCPAGTYAKDNICTPCHASCSECTDDAESSCTACYPGHVLNKGETGSTGTCIPECTGRYAENCEANQCTAVLGGSKYCSKCKSGYVPVDGLCVSSGTRAPPTGCTPGTDGTCSACTDAYFKESGGCYKAGAFPGNAICTTATGGSCTMCVSSGQNPQGQSCPACPAGCSKCSGSGSSQTCSECLAGYYKTSANTCVKCDKDDSNIKGVPNCVSCAPPTTPPGPVTCYVTQEPTVDPTDPSVNKGGLPSGTIAGISVAVIAVVGGLVGFLCWWFVCRGKA
ncbi:Variant-specific surface protein, partial [Giardia duodenalis]